MAYQYPNLWQGCVGAWCPSVDRSRSTLLTDFSGRGNNGLLTGMDPGTDWVASNDKIALDFNMAETNRVVTTFNSTKLYDLSRVTISVWFRARSSGEGLVGRLLDCKEATGFSISNQNSTSSYAFWLNGTNLTFSHDGTTFGHVACVYDSNSSSKIAYSNGKVANQATQTGLLTADVQPLIFGDRYSSYRRFDGILDDIRIYNRALTPSEVAQLASRRGVAYTPMPRRRVYIMGSGGGTRGLRLGSTTINKAYLGSTEIKKVYLGATLIHDTTG